MEAKFMTRHCKAFVLGMSLVILSLGSLAFAAQAKPAPQAPVPAQILTAKKVFIANAGLDEPLFDSPLFAGGPSRAYDQFYADLKASGRYELVGAPADADLLLEIRFTVPAVPEAEQKDYLGKYSLASPYDPQFRLKIRDPKTNALLWTVIEHAQWAMTQGNREKNFDQALTKLVGDWQVVSTQAPATADSANKPR
jgi:hypothetical protein